MAVKLTKDQQAAVEQACKASGLQGDDGALIDDYEPADESGTCFAVATFGRDGEQRYSRFLISLAKSDDDLALELAGVVGAEGSGLGEVYWFFPGYRV